MRFVLRLMGQIVGSFGAILLVIMVIARSAADGYNCVRYNGSQMLGNGLVDTRTGARFGIANPATVRGVASDTDTAPNGKLILYLEPTYDNYSNNSLLAFNLKVRPLLGTGKLTVRRHLPGNASLQYEWSQDSTSIAYTWLDTDLINTYVSITRLPHETIEARIPNFQDIQLMGFSPDGNYVLTSNQGGTPRTVIVWEIDWVGKQLTEVLRYSYRIDYNLMYQVLSANQSPSEQYWWSPSGKWLALMTLDERDNKLILLNPTTRAMQVHDLNWIPYRTILHWSPDDAYLAVASIASTTATRYRLDVFAMDGRSWSWVTNNLIGLQDEHWSQESHTFYYFENTGLTPVYQLMAFHPDTGVRKTAVSSLMPRTIGFSDNDWACVTYVSQNPQLIDLTDAHAPIWLDRVTGCNIAARSKDDNTWIIKAAEEGAFTSKSSWQWLRFEPFAMGELPISSFRYVGWSADGSTLAYASSYNVNLINSATISLMDINTWQSREVIAEVVPSAYLSPDGRWLFAQRIEDGAGVAIMAATDGSERHEQRLNSTWSVLTGPIFWSPDSHAVTYEYQQSSSEHVVEMLDTDGIVRRRFINLPDFAGFPRRPENTVWTKCGAELP